MTKLLPFAAQGSAPFGLRDATTSRPPGGLKLDTTLCSSSGGLKLDTTLCSSSGLDSAVSFWAGGDRQFILRRRLSHLSVICSSKRTSGSSTGGKQAVLEKRNRTVSPSKRKSGGSSDVANLWPAGETVTALEPREEGYVPLVGLFKGNSGRGKTSAAEKSLETPENARNADALSEECTSVLKFEEPASEQSAKVEGVNEEEWVEIDDEEWDRSLKDQEEDVELVEVWEGDLPPMTAEEEAVLLLEAEQELAELERERLDKERRTSHGTASSTTETQIPERTEDSHVSEMEKELARLKDLVSTMEKQLAVEKGRSAGKKKPALSPIPQGLASSPDDSDDDNLGAREHSEEVQRGDTVAPTSKFLEVYNWDEKEGIVKRSDKHQTESQNEVRHGTPLRPLYDASLSEVTLPSSGNGENGHSMLREATTGLQNLHLEKRAGRQRRVEEEEQDEDFELEENEKRSIPAVMRCFDRAKIYVKAGDGGDGVVAFRREKFVPFGGPSGGNGGDGGDVYIEADPGINSLLPFRRSVHFRATRGSHGQGKGKSGATGDHCTVKVPVGTAVKQAEGDGNVLLELIRPGQRGLLLPGGRGGRGNAAFKTGRNKTPQIAENGEEGAEMWLQLELKLVADVGIIGVPNAGKSTLLSAISAARPEIANYPFTTLLPNLGVVDLGFDASMVVADLPGLLEGAHTGYGLGHEFLRHTERCRVLIHVVDGMSPQAQYEYDAVRLELQLFNPELEHKPFLVAYNKMDVPEAAERWESFQDFMRSKGVEPFCMSAATRSGTEEITKAAYNLAKQNAQTESQDEGSDGAGEQNLRSVGDMVKRQRSAPIEEFTVSCDKHTRTWEIDGAGLKRFTQMTNWEYFEAVRRFQHVLNASGVSKSLREQGVKEGDTVIVGELEFNWIDSDDMRSLGEWKRGIRGSKVWPH